MVSGIVDCSCYLRIRNPLGFTIAWKGAHLGCGMGFASTLMVAGVWGWGESASVCCNNLSGSSAPARRFTSLRSC